LHITVECPHCHEVFQVDPSLRGKSMRCPVCRKIFDTSSAEVLPEPDEADFAPVVEEPPGPPVVKTSGTVGDVVPLLKAEIAAPRPPEVASPLPSPEVVEASWTGAAPRPLGHVIDVPPPKPAPQWQPPPVREPSNPVAAPALPPEPSAEEDTSWLGELPADGAVAVVAPEEPSLPEGTTVAQWSPGNWEAPPVRGAGTTAVLPAPAPAPTRPPAKPPNRALRILVAMSVLGLGSLGVFVYLIIRVPPVEPERHDKALERYNRGEFAEAGKRFRDLELDFRDSENQAFYHFMTGLCDLRDSTSQAHAVEDTKKAHNDLKEFLQAARADPQQQKFQERFCDDLGKMCLDLASNLTAEAQRKVGEKPADVPFVRGLVVEARQALGEADAFPLVGNVKEEAGKLRTALADIETSADLYERKDKTIDLLRILVRDESPFKAVAAVRDQLALESQGLPGLPNDDAVKKLLADAMRKHLEAVVYTPAKAAPPAPAEDDADLLTNLLITPPVEDGMHKAPAREGVIFALARGVLYALDAKTGRPLWAARVGLKARLPVWLPRPGKRPALVLVASADRGLVTARDSLTGKPHWRHHMPSPCLGKPLLVDGRIYVPGYEGQIDELDQSGRLLGSFQVGRYLTAGGARQPGTSMLYFPEDSFTVYVLDVATKKCAGILYTEHPPESLHCEPVVLNSPDGKGEGHLLLCQADGVDATTLRLFPLPITKPDTPPAREIQLPGWVSNAPYQDGETLAVVTDTGLLKMFGLKQKGTRDPDLFPLFPEDRTLRGDNPGAALIAHADGYEFWVLAEGTLHRLRKGFDRQTGPKLLDVPPALDLGSPEHAGQTDAGGRTLFLTTRTPSGRSCQAAALDLSDGAVRWKRQLGLVPQIAPLGLGSRVLVQDRGGGLFLFDAEVIKGGGWAVAEQALVPPEAAARDSGTFLLRSVPTKQGHAAFVLSLTGRGPQTKLRLRRLDAGGSELKAQEFDLPDDLTGEPGVWTDHLVLPLGNGILYRREAGEESVKGGLRWRGENADADARGYVVPVGATDFLATDGGPGLQYIDWPEGPMGMQKGSEKVGRRIVAPPAVLPRAKDGALQVLVADADETLTLLRGDALKKVRTWPLGGPVTAGPFVRGGAAGCVVEKNRLVWVELGRKEVAWKYEAPAAIVGEPQLIEGLLVVADQSGRVVGLDPKTGRPAGLPFQFSANVCATAAPLPFGAGRLFVSLSDGTAAVLPLRSLRQDLRDIPSAW
jgi:outer membrane protein assembly factor BamB